MNTETNSEDIILETEITFAQREAAKRFLGMFEFSTSALFALQQAVSELDEGEASPTTKALWGMVSALAKVEAIEI